MKCIRCVLVRIWCEYWPTDVCLYILYKFVFYWCWVLSVDCWVLSVFLGLFIFIISSFLFDWWCWLFAFGARWQICPMHHAVNWQMKNNCLVRTRFNRRIDLFINRASRPFHKRSRIRMNSVIARQIKFGTGRWCSEESAWLLISMPFFMSFRFPTAIHSFLKLSTSHTRSGTNKRIYTCAHSIIGNINLTTNRIPFLFLFSYDRTPDQHTPLSIDT